MKRCYFCQEKIEEIDCKNVELLHKFISGQFKIIPARRTGLCSKHQRKLAKTVKRARIMGLLPFVRK